MSRILAVACFLLLPSLGLAQGVNYCDPPAAVKEDLKKLTAINDSTLPFKLLREQQLAMLQDLVKKYPNDLHVRRRYQDLRRSGYPEFEPLLAEYRAQMDQNPNDPIATYLYSRLLVGRQTKEVVNLSNRLIEMAPDFPWTYLQLAEIYNYPNFRDTKKVAENLKLWTAKCPSSLAGFRLFARTGDKELMTDAERSLRSRLESSMTNEDLLYWDELWTIEFKLKPVTEHAEVRKQIAEDVKRLRAANLNTTEWLETLRAGYKQLGEKTNERWAEDEIVRLKPKSYTARRFIQSRYYDEHPAPKPEATGGEKQAYQRATAQVAGEWLKQWPDDAGASITRIRALTQFKGATNAEVEAAYKGYKNAQEQSVVVFSLPPIEVAVARVYLERGFRLDAVPSMLEKGIAGIDQIEKSGGVSDLYPREDEDEVESNSKYVRQESWPMLAEAYARLKQPAKAREVLAQLADLLKPGKLENDSQKRANAYRQSIYWQAVAKVAEIEQRKLDALTAYQTALSFRLNTPGPGKKDELSDNAKRLWRLLGGTDQGWRAYLARVDTATGKLATAEIASWSTKDKALPEFELSDLQGRKWSLADLKGKVAFINFWATWCGPCRSELPYVQKLREQVKDQNVLVLTLNTDEDLGMVEPFMKENKYSFPVLLGQTYAEGQGVSSIPRNWIVSQNGKIIFEGIGFDYDGEQWLKRAVQMIDKAKSTP